MSSMNLDALIAKLTEWFTSGAEPIEASEVPDTEVVAEPAEVIEATEPDGEPDVSLADTSAPDLVEKNSGEVIPDAEVIDWEAKCSELEAANAVLRDQIATYTGEKPEGEDFDFNSVAAKYDDDFVPVDYDEIDELDDLTAKYRN